MKRTPAHLATASVQHDLPAGSCRVCPRNAHWCRGRQSLNGLEAAGEFTRHLTLWARNRVLGLDTKEA